MALVGMVSASSACYLALHQFSFSPWDEAAHLDYVLNLLHGHLPRAASPVGSETLQLVHCRGIFMPLVGHPCISVPVVHGVPSTNYVEIYFPIYYLIAAVVSFAGQHLSNADALTATRFASVIMYGSGAAVMTYAFQRLGASRCAAAGVGLIVAAVPAYVVSGGTVTPDSLAFLAGSAPLLLLASGLEWRTRVRWGVAVGVLIALMKPNFVPLATFTVLIGAFAPTPRDRHEARSLGRAGLGIALSATPVLVAGVWEEFRAHTLYPGQTSGDGGVTVRQLHTNWSLLHAVADGAATLTQSPTKTIYTHQPELLHTLLGAIAVVLLAGPALIALLPARTEAQTFGRVAALAGLGGFALSCLYLPTTFYALYHSTGTQSRYALPMIPLLAAPLAVRLGTTRVQWVVFLAGAVFTAYTFAVGVQSINT